MRTRLSIPLVVAIVVLCGCATTHKHSGDFGSFLQQELVKRGARLTSSSALLPIQAEWTFTPDEFGFVAFIYGDRLRELDAWFRQACGEPKISVERNGDNQPQRVYDSKVIGVALQYVREEKGVTIICVKKQSR
jgi:hypothetical protein